MRHAAPAALLSAAVALGGCASGGGLAVDPSSTTAFITEAQEATVLACGYLPTAETVAGLFTAASKEAALGLTIGEAVAGIVCGVVAKKSARLGTRAPTAYGVRIRGRFVR